QQMGGLQQHSCSADVDHAHAHVARQVHKITADLMTWRSSPLFHAWPILRKASPRAVRRTPKSASSGAQGCKQVAMHGQMFVFLRKRFSINDLRPKGRARAAPNQSSESLAESGLSHPGGKTFRERRDESFFRSGAGRFGRGRKRRRNRKELDSDEIADRFVGS